MKKSSIILISAIGFLIVAAYFMPILLMKKDTVDRRHYTLEPTGEQTEIPLKGNFTSFKADIIDNNYNIDHADYSRSLLIEIIESDTISTPRLIADRSWASNLTVDEGDSIMNLTVDMKSFSHDANTRSTIFIPEDNELVARLVLPKSYQLNNLLDCSRFDINLINMSNLSIEINRFNDFSLSNCQVTSLTRPL